ILVQPYPSEADAFAAEVFLISYFGRKDLGTGCLRNLTDGGDGISKGTIPWNKGKQGLQEAWNKGVPSSLWMGRPHPMLGKTFPEAIRNKMSVARMGKEPWNKGKVGVQAAWNKGKAQWAGLVHPSLGRKHSKESIQKMSDNRKGRPAWNKGKKKELCQVQ